MSNTKHTPGPWATDIDIAIETLKREGPNSGRKNDSRIDGATIYVNHGSGKGSLIAEIPHNPEDGMDLIADPVHAANAARIVACVNACEGLDDPAAALKAAREALEAVRNCPGFEAEEPYGIKVFAALRLLGDA